MPRIVKNVLTDGSSIPLWLRGLYGWLFGLVAIVGMDWAGKRHDARSDEGYGVLHAYLLYVWDLIVAKCPLTILFINSLGLAGFLLMPQKLKKLLRKSTDAEGRNKLENVEI